jgi:uncharacterized protein
MSENTEAAKGAYDAFSSGDMATLAEGFDENAVWVTSEELPLGGTVSGRDQILANFGEIPNYWSEFSVSPEEFIDAGDWVVVRGTQRATGPGGSFETPFAHLMHYTDGKVDRGEFYADSAKAKDALGS